ncbi:hypothetical protein ANN_00218 [Periplaneta americana]|uniref:Endonuclease-reverse transcriptase n=1 Tax=Periplaneta americana TaxID=6978 RepID=A0ABQ8TQB8_PERAM|nr:hypothetical protein ANN_00218 [Periplaneta americana]
MNPGSNTESYPAFAHIGLRKNPGKNLNQVTCPDWESNPGHLVSRPDALTVTPQLKEIGSLSEKKHTGKPSTNDETIEAIQRAFIQSPKKSIHKCARQLGLPKTKVDRDLKKRLRLTPYKFHLLLALRDDYHKRYFYMIMSRDGNIVRNGNINIGDLSFEEVEKFKYLGATVTNVNDTREEIKRRINMGNACYYSVEKLLSSSLLSKHLKVRIYKTVILPVLLYGCETWTLTLREEHRLRVFENKVLRKIFGAKRDEVTGEWRKLHNTELHALYSSPDIIRNLKSRRLRWAGHVARMGESRNAYRVLVGRPEGKRPLGRPRRRWEDNIKMDLREVGYDDRDWLNLAQDRDRWRAYVRAAMNLRVP